MRVGRSYRHRTGIDRHHLRLSPSICGGHLAIAACSYVGAPPGARLDPPSRHAKGRARGPVWASNAFQTHTQYPTSWFLVDELAIPL